MLARIMILLGVLFSFAPQLCLAQADGSEFDNNYYKSSLEDIMIDVELCQNAEGSNVGLSDCRAIAVDAIKKLMDEYVNVAKYKLADKKHGAALVAAQEAWKKQLQIDLDAGYLQFDPAGTVRGCGGALLLLDLYRYRMEMLIAMRG